MLKISQEGFSVNTTIEYYWLDMRVLFVKLPSASLHKLATSKK